MSSALTSPPLSATISIPSITAPQPDDAAQLVHHVKDGKGFVNPWPSYVNQIAPAGPWKMTKRRLAGKFPPPDTTPPTVTVQTPSFLPTRTQPPGTLRTTWLGHASFLAEFPSGFRVLFDPVFTQRCSPFAFFGPKRFTEMPCAVEDIPFIDAVVISHNHYDHLSHPTVMQIAQRHRNVHFFVPLGNREWFARCGIHNVTELDWWQSREITLSTTASSAPAQQQHKDAHSGSSEHGTTPSASVQSPSITATISCLPCQHTSARNAFDKDRTLWASWAVASGGKSLWFGGDTGYRNVPELPPSVFDYDDAFDFPHCPVFAQIGALRGPFDLGLIPIGAYDPRFVMSSTHANPYDSVNIFIDTRCRRALASHWGTWSLTAEAVMEPPKELRKALLWKGIQDEALFGICDIGESREFA